MPRVAPAPSPSSSAPVEFHEQNIEGRLDEMVEAAWRCVRDGGGKMRRAKSSLRTFRDTRVTYSSSGNWELGEFAVGMAAGITIGVVVALTITPVGWALLASAAAGILASLLINKIFTALKNWSVKRTVKRVLAEMDQADLDGDRYEAIKPTRQSWENVERSIAFVKVLVRDLTKLDKEIAAAKKKDAGFVLTEEIVGASTRGLGSKVHHRGASPQDIVGHRVRRLRVYCRWLFDYIDMMLGFTQDTATRTGRLEEKLMPMLRRQVSLAGNHEGCADNHCYRASEADLQVREIRVEGLDQQRAGALAALKGRDDLERAMRIGAAQILSDELEEDSGTAELVGDLAYERLVGLDADLWGAVVTQTQGAAAGVAFAPLAAMGASLWMKTFSELKQSFSVNYPLQSRIADIRKARQAGSGLDSAVLHAVRKNDTDGMVRALTKVNVHYLDRLKKRFHKLRDKLQELRGRTPASVGRTAAEHAAGSPFRNCAEAADMSRYLVKVYHYLEKMNVHLLLVRAGVTTVRNAVDGKVRSAPPATDPAPSRRRMERLAGEAQG